jgi:hypothetical protein
MRNHEVMSLVLSLRFHKEANSIDLQFVVLSLESGVWSLQFLSSFLVEEK